MKNKTIEESIIIDAIIEDGSLGFANFLLNGFTIVALISKECGSSKKFKKCCSTK